MNEELFKKRTKAVALEIIHLAEMLPKNRTATALGPQLIRSAASIGANYRAACRAKSLADIIAKLRIVEEEADETSYWLELLSEAGMINTVRAKSLITECNEITAMTVASIKTLLNRQSKI